MILKKKLFAFVLFTLVPMSSFASAASVMHTSNIDNDLNRLLNYFDSKKITSHSYLKSDNDNNSTINHTDVYSSSKDASSASPNFVTQQSLGGQLAALKKEHALDLNLLRSMLLREIRRSACHSKKTHEHMGGEGRN